MATKAKTNGTAETVDEVFTASTKAIKENFDRALVGYDELAATSKDNIEALVESANVSQKGLEAINTEALAYSKHAMEEGAAAAKAAFAAKNVQELIELNTAYTKSAFDAYVGAATKMTELFTATAKEASEPLNARVTAVVEAAQTASK